MAGPAMSAAKAVWVASGDGVGVDEVAEALGVVEDSEVEGDALGVDGAAVTTDVAVVAAGAAPVVEGPQPASRVRATTAKPATTRAMGLRTITTPISGVDTSYGRSLRDPRTAKAILIARHRTDERLGCSYLSPTRTTTVGMSQRPLLLRSGPSVRCWPSVPRSATMLSLIHISEPTRQAEI